MKVKILLTTIFLLFLFCCCRISGRESRREEKEMNMRDEDGLSGSD